MGIRCVRSQKSTGLEELASNNPINGPKLIADSAVQLDDAGEMDRMSMAASMVSMGGEKMDEVVE